MIANFKWIEPKPGSMGKRSLYDIQLINADGIACEDGEEGEITVRNMESEHPVELFLGIIKIRSYKAAHSERRYNLKTWHGMTTRDITGL